MKVYLIMKHYPDESKEVFTILAEWQTAQMRKLALEKNHSIIK